MSDIVINYNKIKVLELLHWKLSFLSAVTPADASDSPISLSTETVAFI